MNRTRTFVAAIIALVVTCGILAIGWAGSARERDAYVGTLESNYQRSFGELVSNVNDVEITLSKALVSKDTQKQQECYQKINQQCTICANNLSHLPVNHQSIVETTTFVNKLGGYSYYLSQKLKSGESMSAQDLQSVGELYNWCLYVQAVVNDYANNLDQNFSITQTTANGNYDSSFDKMFASSSQTGMDFPTLIYDGPFSESVSSKQYAALTGNDVSVEEAMQILKNAFREYRVSNLKHNGDIKASFDGYSFSFDTTNRTYFAQVAKKGGFVMSVSSTGNLSKAVLSLSNAETEAEKFAKDLGFDDMKSVWSTTIGGVAYVNLCVVKNNVIIYPDMIKAKVSLDTGSIIGWEALSYAQNHLDRNDFIFEITEQQARQMVDGSLAIISIKKCIVPVEYGTEQLCYEYKCTYNNYTYYVYISGKTGQEVEILRVIKTSNGNMLQ